MESAILATIPTNRLAKGLGGLFFNDACVEGHHVIKRKLTEAVRLCNAKKVAATIADSEALFHWLQRQCVSQQFSSFTR